MELFEWFILGGVVTLAAVLAGRHFWKKLSGSGGCGCCQNRNDCPSGRIAPQPPEES